MTTGRIPTTVHFTLRSDDGHAVELQIRTRIQHAWAQLTERAAAAAGLEVKYGGGPEEIRSLLESFSVMVRFVDLAKVSMGLVPVLEEILTNAGDDAGLEQAQLDRARIDASLTEHETELIEMWANLFPEPGAET